MSEQNRTVQQKKLMIEALEKSLGVVTTACKACGIPRSAHYRWMNEDPNYAVSVNDLENLTLDFAESALHRQIKEGNTTATIFFLKTKGKKRGYIERQELTGAEGKPLSGQSKADYSKLSTKELEQLYGLLRKANTD